MTDLRVDTNELRSSAESLRSVADAAAQGRTRVEFLCGYAGGVGGLLAGRALDEFLDRWSYGLGVLGMDALELSAALVQVAGAFEMIERRLAEQVGADAYPGPAPAAGTSLLIPTTEAGGWAPPFVGMSDGSSAHQATGLPGGRSLDRRRVRVSWSRAIRVRQRTWRSSCGGSRCRRAPRRRRSSWR